MPEIAELPAVATAAPQQTRPLVLPPKKETIVKKVEEKPELTDEERAELGKSAEKFGTKMFRGMPRKKEAKEENKDEKTAEKDGVKPESKDAKGEANKAAVDKKESTDKPAEKAESKTEEKPRVLKAKPAKAPKPEVDIEKLVETTVKSTAKALKDNEKSTERKPIDDVPQSRRSEWESISKAEESGSAHKGAAQTALNFFNAEAEYVKDWMDKHPGEKFSADDEEHDAWYENHEPAWMEKAVDDGSHLIEREKLRKEIRDDLEKEVVTPLKQQLSKTEMREVERTVERVAPTTINQGIAMAVNAMNPDLLKEGVKIPETDPVAHDVLLRVGPKIAHETQAALMLFATRGESMSPKDPLFQKIVSTSAQLEADILETSEKDRTTPDGRTFVKLDEWAGMTEAQQAKHWTVTGDIVAMQLANESAEEAKKLYASENERLQKLAKSRGWTIPETVQKGEEKKKTEEEDESETNGKPRSPSTAAQTTINPGVQTEAKPATDGVGKMFKKWGFKT